MRFFRLNSNVTNRFTCNEQSSYPKLETLAAIPDQKPQNGMLV